MKSQLSVDAQGHLATVSDKINAPCSTLESTVSAKTVPPISTANIGAVVNDGVPALIKVIDASRWDQKTKDAAEIALTAAQLAVWSTLANNTAAPAPIAPDPASGAIAS